MPQKKMKNRCCEMYFDIFLSSFRLRTAYGNAYICTKDIEILIYWHDLVLLINIKFEYQLGRMFHSLVAEIPNVQ